MPTQYMKVRKKNTEEKKCQLEKMVYRRVVSAKCLLIFEIAAVAVFSVQNRFAFSFWTYAFHFILTKT